MTQVVATDRDSQVPVARLGDPDPGMVGLSTASEASEPAMSAEDG
jgi:hypothetical protein